MKPILYVEDEENDAFLVQHAFKKAGVANPLHIAVDGQQALEYFSAADSPAHPRQPSPCLVLMDLKLPLKSGIEVLQWLRAHPTFRVLPVVMLSSSSQDRDVHAAYASGANAFLVKPASAEKLLEVVTRIREFWLDLNQPPPETAPAGRHAP